MIKKALLFIDNQIVKIAYGENMLKCVKFSEINQSHNKKFFDWLFESYSVFIVQEIHELNKESFSVLLDSAQEGLKLEKSAPKKEQRKEQPKISRETAKIIEEASAESNRMLFRSMAEATIIVDDCLTGNDIPGMPGEKQALAIFPYRAIDLASIPQENLKKSNYLKKLIREGTIVPCTIAEAKSMHEEYERRIKEENDARLDSVAPILKERVEDFVVGRGSNNDIMSTHGHEAESIDVSSNQGATNESGEYSLEHLMKLAGADQEDAEAAPVAKRPLASRPAPVVNSPVKAKGISRL